MYELYVEIINRLLAKRGHIAYLQFAKLAIRNPIRGPNLGDKLSRAGRSSYFLISVNHITNIK